MNTRRLIFPLLAHCCLATVACGMPEDHPSSIAGETKLDAGTIRGDQGGTSALSKPVMDPIPPQACGESIPLQGTAKAGTSVFVLGGLSSSGVATDAHPRTGHFCVDVPLLPGVLNTLEIRATDPNLGTSEPVLVTVTQRDCEQKDPETPPEEPKSKNVALGIQPMSNATPSEGGERFLTDGDAKTVVVYNSGPFGDPWLTLRLDKIMDLRKIIVRWRDAKGNGTSFATQYKVLVSAQSNPGDPDPLRTDRWSLVSQITDGDGDVDTFELDPEIAQGQYVALMLLEDDSWTGMVGWESFAIAEIEVWQEVQGTTSIATAESGTCAAISSGL